MMLMQKAVSKKLNPVSVLSHSAFLLVFLLFSFTSRLSASPLAPAAGIDTTKADTTRGFVSLLPETSNTGSAMLFDFNPQVMPFVQDFIRKENRMYEDMKVWGTPYFTLYERILAQWGIPGQLKYLSVIESSLQSNIVSWAGAVGPWQIMPATARRFGLYVGRGYDERTDFYKSTQAAARYLKELHDEFGDWLLVIAAYNVGEGGVRNAIRKSGSNDFWTLQYYLPAETRNHVKKFIATHYFFEGKNDASNTANAQFAANTTAVPDNTDDMEISGKYNSVIVANSLTMDIANFNQLNPHFDENLSKGYSYTLRLPTEKMDVFKAQRLSILKQSVDLMLSAASGAK